MAGVNFNTNRVATRIPTTTSSSNLNTNNQVPRNPANGNSHDHVNLSSESGSGASANLGGLLGGLQDNFGEPAGADEGYGGRAFSARGARNAPATYGRHGSESLSLSDRADVGRLISRSPQIDNQDGTNNDRDRCGGAARFNAMLLDGDHTANARAIRDTLGDRVTPEQRTALEHMEAGRMNPNEAAQLQEALYDYGDGLNGAENNGLNLSDMRRTVADLREHGGLPNTRELNFRREVTDSTTNASHWTVSSRTTHGTHFADSYPQANGYARVTGGSEAAFRPWDAEEDRPMRDSLTFRPGAGGDELQEITQGSYGQWQGRDYTRSAARGSADARAHDLPADF